MTITGIRLQKNGRYAVSADGEYIMSVDERTLYDFGFTKGKEITPDELNLARQAAAERFATDKALTYLSYRDHSGEELRRKLVRTVGEEQADYAVRRVTEMNLIDDGAYADKLAHELLEIRLMGAHRAVFEMTRKGLDRELVREAVEKYDTDPQERIVRFLNKKYPRCADDEKERRRAAAALQRNGYRYEDIRQAMRDYGEEE